MKRLFNYAIFTLMCLALVLSGYLFGFYRGAGMDKTLGGTFFCECGRIYTVIVEDREIGVFENEPQGEAEEPAGIAL